MNSLIVFLDQKITKLVSAFFLICIIFMKKMKSSLQDGILITFVTFMNFNKINETVLYITLAKNR